MFITLKKINLFIFGCIGSLLLSAGLSLVVASRGYSLLRCVGFSLRWLLLLQSTGSRHMGFSSCGTQAQQLWLTGSRAQAQQLWRTGLVATRHVGSSRTRARTRVPCITSRILNHRATREAPITLSFKQYYSQQVCHNLISYLPLGILTFSWYVAILFYKLQYLYCLLSGGLFSQDT